MSRPSSRAIYHNRMEYTQSLVMEPGQMQHRVEHLMTCKLGTRQIQEPKDVLQRLQDMEARGQVWSQDLLLQVRDGWMQLLDIETKEELDSYRLDGIQAMDVALNICSYNSILSITARKSGSTGTNTLLFQCQEVGAEKLKSSLQKAMQEELEQRPRFGGPRPGQDRWQGPPPERPVPMEPRFPQERDFSEEPPYRMAQQEYARLPPKPLSRQSSVLGEPYPARRPPSPEDQDLLGAEMELNRTLQEIEAFVKTVEAQGKASHKKKLKKKKDKNQGGVTQAQYTDCFQKIKHSLNLLGMLGHCLQEPGAPEFVHILFQTLSHLLDYCSEKTLAAQVISPLLTPSAINLLQSCLSQKESTFWKGLGIAWTTSQDHWKGSEPIPYQPTFTSDLMSPKPLSQEPYDSGRAAHGMQAICEFQARNQQELTVAQGEVLEVLDQSKRWWLVKNQRGSSGYIPSNILEPLQPDQGQSPPWTPTLRLSSKPAEVTAWLQAEHFSPDTVKTLGHMNGRQLLHLRSGELQMLCPQEASRILSRLEGIKRMLGKLTPPPSSRSPEDAKSPNGDTVSLYAVVKATSTLCNSCSFSDYNHREGLLKTVPSLLNLPIALTVSGI
ncbi:epidermal growth factor receptor kinase substrate 8-like protein 3 [Sorex fumeus]|uniref:epidermal growth factor receptor kinase substrate 8-like protein 3 n=1 Tax=Sorex fumeus TaxID=62283 RepID=UPI0024AD42C7|nr:epidermal growth factor receptor kinase substrate 8-like protein 3 [Sorex fumeus]